MRLFRNSNTIMHRRARCCLQFSRRIYIVIIWHFSSIEKNGWAHGGWHHRPGNRGRGTPARLLLRGRNWYREACRRGKRIGVKPMADGNTAWQASAHLWPACCQAMGRHRHPKSTTSHVCHLHRRWSAVHCGNCGGSKRKACIVRPWHCQSDSAKLSSADS